MTTIIIDSANYMQEAPLTTLYGDASIVRNRTLSMIRRPISSIGMSFVANPYSCYHAIIAYLKIMKEECEEFCSNHYKYVNKLPITSASIEYQTIRETVREVLSCRKIKRGLYNLPNHIHLTVLSKIFLTRIYHDIKSVSQKFGHRRRIAKFYQGLAHEDIVAYVPAPFMQASFRKLIGIKKNTKLENNPSKYKNLLGKAIKVACVTLLKIRRIQRIVKCPQ